MLSRVRPQRVKLFLIKGLYGKDLGIDEMGVVNAAKVTSVPELMEVAITLKDGQVKGGRTAKCYKCGLYGHKSFDCKAGESKYTRPLPICYKCNETGHKAWECTSKALPRKEADPAKLARVKAGKPVKSCKSEKVLKEVNVVNRVGAKREAAKEKRDVRKGKRGANPVSPKEVTKLSL